MEKMVGNPLGFTNSDARNLVDLPRRRVGKRVAITDGSLFLSEHSPGGSLSLAYRRDYLNRFRRAFKGHSEELLPPPGRDQGKPLASVS